MNHSPEESQRIRAHQLKTSFPVRTEFTSIEEFAGLFSQSASNKNIKFIVNHRNSKCVGCGCSGLDCTFKVNAHFKYALNTCIFSRMHLFHSYGSIKVRINLVHLTTAAILANYLNTVRPKDIIHKISTDYGKEIKYITAYKSLIRFKNATRNILNNSYSYLNSLISSLNSESSYGS